MTIGGYERRRVPAIAGAAVALWVAVTSGCKRPIVGEPAKSAQTAAGPEVEIASASVLANGHVLVALRISQSGAPLSRAAALALAPTFTLATMSPHPVDGLPAWKSLLLTGGQTAAQLPPAGPVTPPAQVITNARQPGVEASGTFAGEGGDLTYEFASALPPGFVATDTLRVGVYLAAATGTPRTNATYDFRPAGGTPAPRDTVLDANCNRCHGAVRAHGGRRVGVKICLTCHTWQHSDPDTVDPAALDGATPATNPNPLELGRLVHRIHRGKNLPTLYQAAAGGSAVPAPALPSASPLPLPFFPGRNTPIVGRKFAVIGFWSREFVFGHVVNRTDNQQPAKVVAGGVVFPRDLRDCDACHSGAPQEYEVLYGISRRTCHGCHPETWFGSAPITDPVHFAHAGGPQADDAGCRGCHVAASPPAQPKVYAPIYEIHVPLHRSPRFAAPTIEIVSVDGLRPGMAPTVRFKLYDRVGTISPPNAPTPASDPAVGGSPVPRAFLPASGGWFAIFVGGPTAPGYSGIPISSADPGNPDPFSLVADANGVFTYPFASTIPASASGTWAVGMEARRRGSTVLYDTAADQFRWPYTGEAVSETPRNALVYVDTATGSFTPAAPGAAVPRRTVVVEEKCASCHDRIIVHGTVRRRVEYCLVCHTSFRTDWETRPKLNGSVNLGATYDGIEERTIDFKVLIHRIHTGGRQGAAALDAIEPFVVYGKSGTVFFFDEGIFPNDLRNCTLCHEGKSYEADAIPPDAPATVANETPTLVHQGTSAHIAGETSTPPIQAACRGCHATGATISHNARYTVSGVEQCPQCHVRGSLSVDVVHGLAAADASAVAATFSSIAAGILAPRCASGGCHGGTPPVNFPSLDAAAAYQAIFQVPSQQASGMNLVEPFAPERSYLLLKLRGEAGSVGGIGTPMPIGEAALDPSQIAAVEAWIASGAPND